MSDTGWEIGNESRLVIASALTSRLQKYLSPPLAEAIAEEISNDPVFGIEFDKLLKEFVGSWKLNCSTMTDDGKTPFGEAEIYFYSEMSDDPESGDYPPFLRLSSILSLMAKDQFEDWDQPGLSAMAKALRRYADKIERGEVELKEAFVEESA